MPSADRALQAVLHRSWRYEGTVRLEFIRRGIGSGRHPLSRSGRGHICGLCPVIQRELNELSFAKHPETSPCFDRRSSAHLESNDASEGTKLASALSRLNPEELSLLMVYGGDHPLAV